MTLAIVAASNVAEQIGGCLNTVQRSGEQPNRRSDVILRLSSSWDTSWLRCAKAPARSIGLELCSVRATGKRLKIAAPLGRGIRSILPPDLSGARFRLMLPAWSGDNAPLSLRCKLFGLTETLQCTGKDRGNVLFHYRLVERLNLLVASIMVDANCWI